jgi:hypothetical protein
VLLVYQGELEILDQQVQLDQQVLLDLLDQLDQQVLLDLLDQLEPLVLQGAEPLVLLVLLEFKAI